jgi:serine/threonine-protein kinase
MSESQVNEFLAVLKKSGLLTPEQIQAAQELARSQAALANISRGQKPSAESIAAELVRQEHLTEWQASQILKGQTGFILQQYRLLVPVGKGGMGHVFRARDDGSGAIVAIKVMSRKLSGNQALVNRFRREIRASSQLNSPHIVRTLDAGCVGNVDFMVMEFVNGDQLDRVLSRISTVPVAMACDIVRQVAVGLQHAHEKKMVHRDIKPGNLIVDWSADGRGTVKIMDMGLVRLGTEEEERTAVTRAGQVMGTPDYMSPEQGWDTATVDIRSDIYSLGCTFFRLLTGRVPFPGDNPLQVLMARCSRDAPSARTLRAEIPEPIDAILRKMTLRDPAGRFQTPQDIVDALVPFSSPLTVECLRQALTSSGNAILPEQTKDLDVGDPQDSGYQQFLREMESGAAVDLMMSGSSGSAKTSAITLVRDPNDTIPILSQSDHSLSKIRRPGSRSSRTAGIIGFASGGAALALLILFLVVNSGSSDNLNRGGDWSQKQQTKMTSDHLPRAALVPAQPITVRAGQELYFQSELSSSVSSANLNGEMRFQLGKGAPAGAAIDAATGAVSWSVAQDQTPAAYDLPIELVFVDAGKSEILSSTNLVVTVEAGTARYSLPNTESQRLMTQTRFQIAVKATPEPRDETELEYRLGSGRREGMQIDSKSGEFSWTPKVDDLGRHVVSIELFNPKNSHVEATGSVVLWVENAFELPSYTQQIARAGELFRMPLLENPPAGLGRDFRLRIGEGAPTGVVVDDRTAVLTWNVPKDAAGRNEILLILEAITPEFMLPPDARSQSLIVVTVATSTAPESLMPAREAIDATAAELRELFKRDLATARSVSEKAALSRQMLERSITQSANAADFALLDLIAELAEKGRATDVGLQVIRIRSERYQAPELPGAIQLATEFRVNSVNAAQVDLVIEEFLRLADSAIQERRYGDIARLLGPPEQLLKKSDRGTVAKFLADDVSKARQLAEDLSAEGTGAVEIKVEELTRVIQKWQFKPLFSDGNSLSYVESSGAAKNLPDSGRSLWKFEKNEVRLAASQRNASLGILDPSRDSGRFLLRMQLSAETTSALLIFGAGREQNLNAHLLTLDGSAFGRIVTVPNGAVVQNAASGVSLSASGWNDVEVFVDGSQIRVRLNGVLVVTAQLPDLQPGQIGILVSLERSPIPTFTLRRPRILLLPKTP